MTTLQQFLDTNPKHQSQVLAYAEKKRIIGILALHGVRLSDDIKSAIDTGKTPESYAVDALTKQREIEARAPNPAVFGHDPQILSDQATVESVKSIAQNLGVR